MSVAEKLAHFFKPEVRKQGFDYFEADSVFLQVTADTQIQALINGTSRVKVRFTTTSIANSSFDADCSCPSSAKGQLCKHIWATLLAVEKNFSDFLDSKQDIQKVDGTNSVASAKAPRVQSQGQIEQKEKLKAKQSEYRKQQYQKQKEVIKERKFTKKGASGSSKFGQVSLPEDVQASLKFFTENGFEFSDSVTSAELANARKILARIFHPDKGGSHAEALLLNENYEILLSWILR